MERTIAPLESEQRGRNFLATESENALRILAPQWWPFKKGEMGCVKGELKGANFRQGKVYKLDHHQVRIFGKGKCKLIANFSTTMVTSLPSHSDPPTVHSPLSLSVFVARFWLPVLSLGSHSSLVCNPKQSKLLRVFFNGIFLRTLSLKPHVFVWSFQIDRR